MKTYKGKNNHRFNLKKVEKNDKDRDGSTLSKEQVIRNARLYNSITTTYRESGFHGKDFSKVNNITYEEFENIKDICDK
tara:strand:+ start:334 stop:570 length:237 start_codon:yes stop_codon:yes gene_type:complete